MINEQPEFGIVTRNSNNEVVGKLNCLVRKCCSVCKYALIENIDNIDHLILCDHSENVINRGCSRKNHTDVCEYFELNSVLEPPIKQTYPYANLQELEKVVTLSRYTGVIPEDVSLKNDNTFIFEVLGDKYLVCTNEEANELAADHIKGSLWTYTPDFISKHSTLSSDLINNIIKLWINSNQPTNSIIIKLIKDMDKFIEDVIAIKSRGVILSTHDGKEFNSGKYYIYQIN